MMIEVEWIEKEDLLVMEDSGEEMMEVSEVETEVVVISENLSVSSVAKQVILPKIVLIVVTLVTEEVVTEVVTEEVVVIEEMMDPEVDVITMIQEENQESRENQLHSVSKEVEI